MDIRTGAAASAAAFLLTSDSTNRHAHHALAPIRAANPSAADNFDALTFHNLN
jgi:hypothetical protein